MYVPSTVKKIRVQFSQYVCKMIRLIRVDFIFELQTTIFLGTLEQTLFTLHVSFEINVCQKKV